jgi:hypothetical protein
LQFSLRPLEGGPPKGLAGYKADLDKGIPASFGQVALFIDDARAKVGGSGEPNAVSDCQITLYNATPKTDDPRKAVVVRSRVSDVDGGSKWVEVADYFVSAGHDLAAGASATERTDNSFPHGFCGGEFTSDIFSTAGTKLGEVRGFFSNPVNSASDFRCTITASGSQKFQCNLRGNAHGQPLVVTFSVGLAA